MITLIDTSIWVDLLRARTPQEVQRYLAPYILHPSAHLAEPVRFEILRNARPAEAHAIDRQMKTLPVLSTPTDLWPRSIALGQACRKRGHSPGAIDLLIATVAAAHDAVVLTLDSDFEKIGEAGNFQVRLLQRPSTKG